MTLNPPPYYYIVYLTKEITGDIAFHTETLSGGHPLVWYAQRRKEKPGPQVVLLNWEKLTEEEYRLFLEERHRG